LAGWNGAGKAYNDVWYSDDGNKWDKFLLDSPWPGREDPICEVFNNKIYIMGGMKTGGHRVNDVWYLE
jgi:N-acetylneuraminic acid mutarotase